MKKAFKIFFYAILFCIGIFILIAVFSGPEECEQDTMGRNWTELNGREQAEAMQSFIKSECPHKKAHGKAQLLILMAMKRDVKFPETLEFYVNGSWREVGVIPSWEVRDAENGLINASGQYRAENALGQKVRGSYRASFKYDGNDVSIVDFAINP